MLEEPHVNDVDAAGAAGGETGPDRPVVLVVDDDLALLFLAHEALGQDGFSVEEAADGIQAITVFERVRPDLVLLDVNLPGADGFSVCTTLRGMAAASHVPIVMMTAVDDVRAVHRAYEVGATDFITKPLLWPLLGHRLRYVLRSSRTAEHLRRSRARLARAQGIARLGDGELDFATQTVDWSEEALRILGLPPHPSRVPLAGCWSCVHPADREAVGEALAVSTSPDPGGLDFRVRPPGGEERVVHLQVERIADDSGGPGGLMATVHDVTERARFEARLQQGQRLEAMGRLSAGVAHDFNNLLTVIIGHSELLLARASAEDPGRRALQLIRDTGRQAGTLTGQLLAFSRGQVLRREALDLRAVITGMEPLIRRLIGEHITPVFEADPEVGSVSADRTQIEQILLNLLVNARDAMPKGGRVRIRVANADLDAGFVRLNPGARPGPHVALSVTDEGVGIPPEIQARLFEPFFTTKGDKGTGLGLATVYGIVQQHEGYIRLESTSGQGSRFTVYLGRVDAAAPPPPAAAGSLPAPARRGATTVLLTEDDPQVRGLIRQVLERGGYTILEACHGREALALAGAHRGPIDLLVTDVLMPELGGVALARTLTAARPGLKVLFISGYTDDMLRAQGLAASETAFLPKPFTPEALLRSVGQVLPRRTS